MRRPRTGATLIRRALTLLAVAILPGACSVGVLAPGGPVGRANTTILYDALGIMLAIVVPTIIAALVFAWWFRASNPRAQFRPHFTYSGRIELVVWSIPIVVILFLAGMIWIGSHDLDPATPLPIRNGQKPVEVQVVALDWKWLFIYPEHSVASVNLAVVPAGVPVHFSITSASVMNAFFVPRLGSMIYAMYGMMTQLNLQADEPGAYDGRSADFSGDGFAKMQFTLRAVPAEGFAQWVEQARHDGPVLDRAGLAALARPGAPVAPFTYRATDPALFPALASGHLPPAPGPATQPGAGATTIAAHAQGPTLADAPDNTAPAMK